MLLAADVMREADKIGTTLSEAQAAQFVRYAAMLADWNTRFNLTAISDDAGILSRHFIDSLTVLRGLPPGPLHALDVGTGAGFPGIALKIARPEINVTLMDGTGKKLIFCDTVIAELGLREIVTLKGRADDLAHQPQYREKFDAVLARAVAALSTLAEYLLPFCKNGGVCIAMKGSDAETELTEARSAIKQMGGHLKRVERVTLPGLPDARALILLDKIAPTPEKFPRAAGLPRSKPIQ